MIIALKSLCVLYWLPIQRKVLSSRRAILVSISALLCSACVTVSFGEYETVVLEEQFESTATRIFVKAPVSRYRDRFYNISMDGYQVSDTSIGDTKLVKSDRKEGPDRTVVEDDTLWNLILKGELTKEKVYYNQYRVDGKSLYSFVVSDDTGGRVDVACQRDSISLENEETGRFAIGLGEISDEKVVERYGEWLASKLSCSITGDGEQWSLVAVTEQDAPPTISLSRAGGALNTTILDFALAGEPATGGRQPADDLTVSAGAYLPGVSFAQGADKLAVVSLGMANTTIWLGAAADTMERRMLVAAGYSLILSDWVFYQ